jgi:hypothetical protein
MSLPLLTRAFATTQAVIDGVQPAELDLPTPCGEYDVRRLLEHLIGWQLVFAACAIDAEPPLVDGSPTYLLTGEPGAELRSASMALTPTSPAEPRRPSPCRIGGPSRLRISSTNWSPRP